MDKSCSVLPSGVAVDFGGTKIAAARVTHGVVGDVLVKQTDGEADAIAQVDTICGLLDQLQLLPHEKLAVALAGRVDRQGNWMPLNTETLSGIESFPLGEILSKRLQRNVTVENDATAAAVGEFVAGAGAGANAAAEAARGAQSMAFITVSTGVGGGIILNGRPLTSSSGLAGHVGFTTSRIVSGMCGSGRRQTVENAASGRAIAAQATAKGHEGIDAKGVYEAHLEGADWATEIIQRSASAIAELCANLQATLDLDLVVLGGSLGLADGYLEMVQASLREEPVLFQPTMAAAELGIGAALIGALCEL
jgi:N-acylmannosamine kinase